MNNPDQDTVLRAVQDARRILGEYIDLDPRDPAQTLERLLAVLDRGGLPSRSRSDKQASNAAFGGMRAADLRPELRPR